MAARSREDVRGGDLSHGVHIIVFLTGNSYHIGHVLRGEFDYLMYDSRISLLGGLCVGAISTASVFRR